MRYKNLEIKEVSGDLPFGIFCGGEDKPIILLENQALAKFVLKEMKARVNRASLNFKSATTFGDALVIRRSALNISRADLCEKAEGHMPFYKRLKAGLTMTIYLQVEKNKCLLRDKERQVLYEILEFKDKEIKFMERLYGRTYKPLLEAGFKP